MRLYLPAYMAFQAGSQYPRVEGCMAFMTHEEVYGRQGSSDDLERILSRLPSEAVVLSVAKLNALLYWYPPTDRSAQRGLLHELVETSARQRALELLEQPDRVAFFEEQLLALMKHAILFGKPTGDVDLSREWDEVIRAAFLTSELIGREHAATGDDERDLTLMAVRSLYFNTVEPPANLLARYYDLWLVRPTQEPHLNSPDYVNIEAAFREATGVDIVDYLAAGFALLAHFMRFKTAKAFEEYPFGVSWDDLNVSLPERGAAKRFVQHIAQPVRRLAREFRSMPSKPGLAGASLLPFFRTPVVLMQSGDLVPVSLRLLFEKLTDGVYWTLLEHMKARYGDKGFYRFTRFVGELFQAHVYDALSHAYADSPLLSKRLFGEVRYGQPEVKGADATLIYGDVVVFFEVSTSRLRYQQTVLRGDLEAFDEDIEKCVIGNAKQLTRVVADFRRGDLVFDGLDPARVHHIFPVIVLLEPFPEFPLTWRRVRCRLQEEGYLTDCEPLQIMSAEDLEMVEPLLAEGQTFESLLAAKTRDPVFVELSMKNFLLARFPNRKFRGERLEKMYRQLSAMIKDRLKVEEQDS
jgi:hypothetical protein